MWEKIKKISNPLTIIGGFAALSEIFAAVVLPSLPLQLGSIFIYFVMGFPVLLVLLFFITLYTKPAVLYAPSDYVDENNFLVGVGKPSAKEIIYKKTEEVNEVNDTDPKQFDSSNSPEEQPTNPDTQIVQTEIQNGVKPVIDDSHQTSEIYVHQSTEQIASKTDVSKIQPDGQVKEISNDTKKIISQVDKRWLFLQFFENSAIDEIQKIYPGKVVRDVTVSGSNYLYDAIIQHKDELIFVEVKFASHNTSIRLLNNNIREFIKSVLFHSNLIGKKKIVIAIVYDSSISSIPKVDLDIQSMSDNLEIFYYDITDFISLP